MTVSCLQAVVNDIKTSLNKRTSAESSLKSALKCCHSRSCLHITISDIFDDGGCTSIYTIRHEICQPRKTKGFFKHEKQAFDVVGSLPAGLMVCQSRIKWTVKEDDRTIVEKAKDLSVTRMIYA